MATMSATKLATVSVILSVSKSVFECTLHIMGQLLTLGELVLKMTCLLQMLIYQYIRIYGLHRQNHVNSAICPYWVNKWRVSCVNGSQRLAGHRRDVVYILWHWVYMLVLLAHEHWWYWNRWALLSCSRLWEVCWLTGYYFDCFFYCFYVICRNLQTHLPHNRLCALCKLWTYVCRKNSEQGSGTIWEGWYSGSAFIFIVYGTSVS